MKTKSKALKITGIVILAAVVLFSAASLIIVEILLSDTFSRTAPREYTFNLRYADAADRYEREAVEFLSGENLLRGHLYGAGGSEGLVVVSHGLGGGEESYLPQALYLVDRGYQVLCYSNTGCWDSEGEDCIGLCQSVLDLDAALTWVESESRFDGVPVFLFGHSWGGYAVTAIFHFDHDITASASVAGFNDPMSMILEWGEGMIGPVVYAEAPFIWINQKFTFGDILGLRAVDAINSVDTPVLILHGDEDTTVGYTTTGIIAAKEQITNPNVRYIVCDQPEQNDHNGLLSSLDSIHYAEELQEEYDVIYEQYGGEIPEDVLQAFYAPVDKFRASAADGELMENVIRFYQEAAAQATP